jgi:hypothetical protein
MGSLENRISRLEGRIEPPEDLGAELRRAVVRDILDELARLKASRAVHYRGGNPPTPIEPENIPGKILGPGYTTGQMVELAVRRVFERKYQTTPGVLEGHVVEDLVRKWTSMFEAYSATQGLDWNKVEDDGKSG